MNTFDYQAPDTLGDAIKMLSEGGSGVRILAGGTDILVQHRNRTIDARIMLDIKRIPELSALAFNKKDGLTIGAGTICARLLEHPEVLAKYPGLVDAVSHIGGIAIQNRATIGGNLCNAAPSADSVPPLIVYDAVCVVMGPLGERRIPVAEFCTAPGKTVLEAGEILVSFSLPPQPPRSGVSYLRFIPRHEMDIAVAGVAAGLELDDVSGRISAARLALGAVAATPILVENAGKALIGLEPSDDTFSKAVEVCRRAAAPISDIRGSELQRRHLIGVLASRALRIAAERAGR